MFRNIKGHTSSRIEEHLSVTKSSIHEATYKQGSHHFWQRFYILEQWLFDSESTVQVQRNHQYDVPPYERSMLGTWNAVWLDNLIRRWCYILHVFWIVSFLQHLFTHKSIYDWPYTKSAQFIFIWLGFVSNKHLWTKVKYEALKNGQDVKLFSFVKFNLAYTIFLFLFYILWLICFCGFFLNT